MDVAIECGCKDIYIFPHITYPSTLVSALFGSSIPLPFIHFVKSFSFVIIRI